MHTTTEPERTRDCHPLVDWLCARLLATDDATERAVVAPSATAARALGDAVVARRGALLGVHFTTAPGLARLLAERCGRPAPARRPDLPEERMLLRGCLADRRGPTARYARRFPAALDALLYAIREWQTAGWPAPAAGLGAPAREVVDLAADYDARTARLATRSNTMRTALAALGDGRTAELPAGVFLCGMRAVPGDLRALLARLAEAGVAVDMAPFAARPPDRVRRIAAAGPIDELRLAAAACLDLAASGVPWSAMVVTAPNLGRYAPHLCRAFAAEGVPFRAALQRPLAREARGALWLHAARVLFGDAPRASFHSLLSAPDLHDPTPPGQQRVFDALSRAEHFGGRGPHAASFVATLRRHLARRCPGERPLAAWHLQSWLADAEAAAAATTAAARGAAVQDFVRRHFREPGPGRDQDVEQALAECSDALARAWPSEASCPERAFVAEFEQLARDRGLPLSEGAATAAVHVVEADDALAIPAEHLHVLGVDRSLVPGPAPPETFFTDADRRLLGLVDRDASRSAQAELLADLFRHPTGSLVISRPRRGTDDRTIEPTTWWRRLARVFATDVAEHRTPAHPMARAHARLCAARGCPPDLALAHLALGGSAPEALAEVAGPDAIRRWRASQRLERFDPDDLSRDGDLGAALGSELARRPLSVTALRTLGYCPHQFLFETVFGLVPLPPEPDPLELPRDRLGTRVHRVLELVYGEALTDLGASEAPTEIADRLVARAGEILRDELVRHGGPLARDFPTLHALIARRWRDALDAAIRLDLAAMQRDGSRPLRIEDEARATLVVTRAGADTRPRELTLEGRIDRIDRLPGDLVRVVDFKTGRNPAKDVDPGEILRARRPQLVAYALLLEQLGERVAAIAVRAVRPATGAAGVEPVHELAEPRTFLDGEAGRGFSESLAVLAELRERGAFVPGGEHAPCAFCRFRTACRRLHPPSAERVDRAAEPEIARWFRLVEKSRRRPLLGAEDQDEDPA